MKRSVSILLSLAFIFSCSFSAIAHIPNGLPESKANDGLYQKWIVAKISQYTSDVTAEYDPNKDSWFEFKSDGTFDAGGSATGNYSGKYEFSDENNTLKFTEAKGELNYSTWKITVEDGKMTMSGITFDGFKVELQVEK